ncbi:MAG: IS1 family transposase [Flavobacteriales bacterium]
MSFTPRKIYTDGLPVYKYLVPPVLHGVFQRCINYIERKNLTLRQHLRRLSRRTLGYSRSPEMLQALLRIYCAVRETQVL